MKSEIAVFAKASPFVPFEIELVGGRVLSVPHPDFVYVPPGKGIFFVLTHPDGTPETLNALLVVAIRPSRSASRRRRAG